MKNIIKPGIWIFFFLLPSSLFAWQWVDLWQTADQQGTKLLQAGKANEAAHIFANKDWQAVALYRSGQYAQAFQHFNKMKTSDAQYNAGNAAAYLGHYQKAMSAYDKAITLNPKNTDAIANREIIKKLMQNKMQTQNNSSANSKNNEKENKNPENNRSPTSQQAKDQLGSSVMNHADKQDAQNNVPKNSQEKSNQQTQTNNSAQTQSTNMHQELDQSRFQAKQQKEKMLNSKHLQAKEEDKKQLLRRLTDDTGSLLQQKFLRDYFHRHTVDEHSDQGEN